MSWKTPTVNGHDMDYELVMVHLRQVRTEQGVKINKQKPKEENIHRDKIINNVRCCQKFKRTLKAIFSLQSFLPYV